MSNNLIHIGHVAKTHGLNGHFTIKLNMPYELCELFHQIKRVYISPQKEPFLINNAKLNNNIFLKVKSNSINTRDDAKNILRKDIYIKKGEHPKIDQKWEQKNELLNFKLIENEKSEIGTIKEIDFNRPQPLLIVQNKNQTILVPFVNDFITHINRETKTIYVELPENLIQICTQ